MSSSKQPNTRQELKNWEQVSSSRYLIKSARRNWSKEGSWHNNLLDTSHKFRTRGKNKRDIIAPRSFSSVPLKTCLQTDTTLNFQRTHQACTHNMSVKHGLLPHRRKNTKYVWQQSKLLREMFQFNGQKHENNGENYII